MKNILIKLREMVPTLSATEKEIADFILSESGRVPDLTVRELAAETFSSPSSVIRICRRLGFSGYRDFHKNLVQELATVGAGDDDGAVMIGKDDSVADIIHKVSIRNIRSMEDSEKLLDVAEMEACVDRLVSCRRLLLFGIGSSYCVANDAYLKFLRINKECLLNEDWHSQLLSARNASPSDFAIVFSYSGQTEEMITCMEALKENGTPCCAVTRLSTSPVSKLADYKLYIASTEPLFRNGAMSSRINQLNIVDILFSAFINRQYEYSIKQLTRTHIHKESEKSMQ